MSSLSSENGEEPPAIHTGGGKTDQSFHDRLPTEIRTTRYMILFSIVISVSGFMLGFDTSYSGNVLLMNPFINSFGQCIEDNGVQSCSLSTTQQAITSISNLFIGIGCALTVPTNAYFGRRAAIQVGCLFVSVGAAGQLATAGNFTNYMVCKCIAAVGIGHFIVAAVTWGVECTSPQKRGLLLSFFGIGNTAGTVAVAAVCLGSSKIPTDWAWRTPILCQIPIAFSYAALVLVFPESPRWLMNKGREEKARKSFAKFYHVEDSSELVSAQIRDTRATIELEKAMSSTTSPLEIFHRSQIKRTLIASLPLTASSLSGIWFVVPYAAIFLADVGISNPFLINVIFGSCAFGGSLCGPFVVEYWGRRASTLWGYGIMACCMLIFSVVSTCLGSDQVSKDVLVAFLCIWDFTFGALIGSSSWLTSVEVHSVRLRTYGQSFASMVGEVMAFAASFWTPYMLGAGYGNMGTNVGYFYLGLELIALALVFWLVPETARLSLEQVDDIFVSKIPAWKTSLGRNKRIVREGRRDLGFQEGKMGQETQVSKKARLAALLHMRKKIVV